MKLSNVCAMLVAAVMTCGLGVASAQAQQGFAGQVAIVDIGYIFKSHVRFNQAMQEIHQSVAVAEREMQAAREQVTNLAARLKEVRRGTPDYTQLEEDVARRQADLNLQMGIKRRNFLEAEARLYNQVYSEILQQITYYAQTNNITLVLRFDGDKVEDQADPQQVMKQLTQTVVYHNPAIDITPIIRDMANGGAQVPNGGLSQRPAGPSAMPPRQ